MERGGGGERKKSGDGMRKWKRGKGGGGREERDRGREECGTRWMKE